MAKHSKFYPRYNSKDRPQSIFPSAFNQYLIVPVVLQPKGVITVPLAHSCGSFGVLAVHIQFRADLAEGRQGHAERATLQLESERERLTREVAPLTAAAEAFRQASGAKPDKKQIPALLAEIARLKTELKYSHEDQHGLFTELQKSEKEKAILKREAEITRTLITHAPDKLQEAMDTAKQRREEQNRPSRSDSFFHSK